MATGDSEIQCSSNICYFPVNDIEDLFTELSIFEENHPGLKVTGMASDNSLSYGETRGYLVIFNDTVVL